VPSRSECTNPNKYSSGSAVALPSLCCLEVFESPNAASKVSALIGLSPHSPNNANLQQSLRRGQCE
jgi:hypothetical protein